MSNYQHQILCDCGPRNYQQDYAKVVDLPTGTLYMVADGMGGHENGAEAARLAVSAFEKYMLSLDPLSRTSHEIALRSAHTEVQSLSQPYLWCGRPGCTFTSLFLPRDETQQPVCAHVGDSSIWADYGGWNWIKVTERHGRRNVLFAYLGQYEDLQFLDLVGYTKQADTYLLTSDGLAVENYDSSVVKWVPTGLEPRNTYLKRQLEFARAEGSTDNATGIMIWKT